MPEQNLSRSPHETKPSKSRQILSWELESVFSPSDINIFALKTGNQIADISHGADFLGCQSDIKNRLNPDDETDVIEGIPFFHVPRGEIGTKNQGLIFESFPEQVGQFFKAHNGNCLCWGHVTTKAAILGTDKSLCLGT